MFKCICAQRKLDSADSIITHSSRCNYNRFSSVKKSLVSRPTSNTIFDRFSIAALKMQTLIRLFEHFRVVLADSIQEKGLAHGFHKSFRYLLWTFSLYWDLEPITSAWWIVNYCKSIASTETTIFWWMFEVIFLIGRNPPKRRKIFVNLVNFI